MFAPVLLTETATSMGGLLGNLGSVATEVLSTVGEVATKIVSTPILLMTTGILFLGGAIGIFGRLLSKS